MRKTNLVFSKYFITYDSPGHALMTFSTGFCLFLSLVSWLPEQYVITNCHVAVTK